MGYTCRNMRTSVKLRGGYPETAYISGIGHVAIDLNEATVEYILDGVLFGPISFFENKDRISFMLSHIARETNRVPFADVSLNGELEYRDRKPLTLYASLLKFSCTTEQLREEIPSEKRLRENMKILNGLFP